MFDKSESLCKSNLSVVKFSNLLHRINPTKHNFFIHMNVRSLNKNINKLEDFLKTLPYLPKVIVISETKLKTHNYNLTNIQNYNFHSVDSPTNSGGIAMYIHSSLSYKLRPDLSLKQVLVEDLWLENLF